jgi:iron complex outermembrane recepter protein
MQVSISKSGSMRSRVSAHFLVQAAVAAALAGTTFTAYTAEESKDSQLEEITVTGSRITRRDTESTSPLVTVEKEVLEKSSYISVG